MKNSNCLFYRQFPSPVGSLKLIASQKGLVTILWENENFLADAVLDNADNPVLNKTSTQLTHYFKQQLKTFDLPLDIQGTEFQQKVWACLPKIPYGKTLSYLDVAMKIAQPNAVRAVGTAIGKNPLPIIIPCHRVIASNGKLAGFAGGLSIKKFLLHHENEH